MQHFTFTEFERSAAAYRHGIDNAVSEGSKRNIAALVDNVLDALCDSNPEWTAGQCVELKDLLCEDKKAETEKANDAE